MNWKFHSETHEMDEEARQGTPGAYVRLPDGVTHYELGGSSAGQVVVLVHGFSVPYYIWDPTFPALVEAGFRTLRYDLFGRGYSDRPPAKYDGEFFSRQLLHLLEALKLNQPVDLVGISMGGAISAHFTAHFPQCVRKVVFIDPAGMPLQTKPMMSLLKPPLIGELIFDLLGSKMLVAGQGDDFHHPERFPDYQSKYPYQLKYKGFKAALLSTVRGDILEGMQACFEQIGKLQREVLLIWGREDRTIPYTSIAQIRAAIPKAIFQPIDQVGHIPHYERPELVNPLIVDFLHQTHR